MNDFERVRRAIEFISAHKSEQPDLAAVASHLSLSNGHLQKLFLRWAGLTPKRFLQALTVEDAKIRLAEGQPVLDTANELGLSSASRLYDHFIELEAVTPGDFKAAGLELVFSWAMVDTPFGTAFIGFSEKGVSRLHFIDNAQLDDEVQLFKKQWHAAELKQDQQTGEVLVKKMFSYYLEQSKTPGGQSKTQDFKLRVYGTNFQIAVWRALLQQPWGALTSYSELANKIAKPKAVRAVASAVGANPIACLIPCHRVIRQSGALGGYRWGLSRKQAILVKESLR